MSDRTADRMADPTDTISLSASPSAARVGARRGLAAAVGAIGAAFLASLCCVGPLLFVTLGIGAGLASQFEPLRPVFTVVALGLLAVGFYVVYGRRPAATADDIVDPACAPGGSCVMPRDRARDKILLWTATILTLVLLTFPQWSVLLV